MSFACHPSRCWPCVTLSKMPLHIPPPPVLRRSVAVTLPILRIKSPGPKAPQSYPKNINHQPCRVSVSAKHKPTP